ncbi:substrate-binding domain-containing protein [Fuchsiella alkaliacetigena]|uniref:substrate-binding domain-containing protein n=1 Tax=Fuchsiella alkaliacetigena TaxID=957042 RepID=UPI00200AF59B|nr:substrate-binding domain-containing protein [Fuchsiella alkaliacetigena]MCK8825690.1 substrate-binding domain-containing protein [Fuchsiella alkaliacetigena]
MKKATKKFILLVLIAALMLTVTACGRGDEAAKRLILATTTSTYDSGLLGELMPQFEEEKGYDVEIIALGTGQALEIGRRGDVDIILAHAKELEEEFVAEGYGTERTYVMYNEFVVLGPEDDPANLKGTTDLGVALQSIEETASSFASRGDDSGTHTKELNLWDEYGIDVAGDWYNSLGQGMGDTLITANEMQSYTLADRGTYLSMEDQLPNLTVVFEGAEQLFNTYGVIPINPERHDVNYEGVQKLVEFFIRDDIQEKIGKFGGDEFAQPLFFPAAD